MGSSQIANMKFQLMLLRGRVPLYVRFLMIAGLILAASSGKVHEHVAYIAQLLMFAVLFKRWLRCQQSLPSKHCCNGPSGKPLIASLKGLHRRFLELYGAKDTDRSDANEANNIDEANSEKVNLDEIENLDETEDPELTALGLQRRLRLADGQELAYWDVGPQTTQDVVLLCNGLGARIASWTPLFDALHGASASWAHRRIIIPEYRGQFNSLPLKNKGSISVERSAADVAELAKALDVRRCMVLCWSTGVQIGLELALTRPDLVEAMVLIQGTTGRALESLMQPAFTIPFVPTILAKSLAWAPCAFSGWRRQKLHALMVKHTELLEFVGRCALWVLGSDLIAPIGVRYVQDMFRSDEHFKNYCSYVEGLGRHEILEKLPDIRANALIVTGTPDFVTPARCSYDMAACLGGSTVELFDDPSGSHYYIFEEPKVLAARISHFLEKSLPLNPA
eukprot:TRINITY_DN41383_c0_g1_i1.p1 TRINITY_DN41383_c0_g1~~TRINITY_DN41383_c0_g1_i1.p1  ORF type:complete len:451 (-),score=86.91 TRINITY_DN41383_c0_g1_i1:344-1696(-)